MFGMFYHSVRKQVEIQEVGIIPEKVLSKPISLKRHEDLTT